MVARWAATGLVCFIFVASVFGRQLERGFPALLPFIPAFGLLCLVLGAGFIRRLARAPSAAAPLPYRLPRRRFELAAAMAILLGAVLTCELLVQLPIERVHFFKYSVLAVLLYFSQRPTGFSVRCLTAFAAAGLVGILDENLQRFIPLRFFDPNDILLNVAASGWGVFFAPFLDRWAHGFPRSSTAQNGDSAGLD